MRYVHFIYFYYLSNFYINLQRQRSRPIWNMYQVKIILIIKKKLKYSNCMFSICKTYMQNIQNNQNIQMQITIKIKICKLYKIGKHFKEIKINGFHTYVSMYVALKILQNISVSHTTAFYNYINIQGRFRMAVICSLFFI